MKPAVYLFWLFCTALFCGGQAYAGSSSPVEKSAFQKGFKSAAAKVELKSAENQEAAVATEFLVADDDNEDEDQRLTGKQPPVIAAGAALFALSDLPPPASTQVHCRVSSQRTSFLRSCRYIAQRALRI